MIPVFRKIRKQLADDNRPLKYLRYAFGEIVLVVIGILIALGINNWNEQRKQRVFEMKMLHEVRSSLINDITLMGYLTKRTQKIDSCAQKVITYYGTDNVNADSLIQYVNCVRMGISFTYNSGSFDAISSVGMNKITNDSLRKELIYLYGYRMPRMKQLIEYNRLSYYGEFNDFFYPTKIVKTDGTIEIKYVPKSKLLLHNPAFLNYIYNYKEQDKEDRIRVNYVLNSSNKLLRLLNKVLDKEDIQKNN